MTLSPYLLAVGAAWLVAQGSKFLIGSVKDQGTIDFRQLYASGNMPSSHSAAVIALMTVIGLEDGTQTAAFAIGTLLAVIVMYDALMVRRSTGEQGVAIQALIKEQKSHVRTPRSARGHEPLEVAVGALVGFVAGLVVFFITR